MPVVARRQLLGTAEVKGPGGLFKAQEVTAHGVPQ
jgi:hypothetical protein